MKSEAQNSPEILHKRASWPQNPEIRGLRALGEDSKPTGKASASSAGPRTDDSEVSTVLVLVCFDR